MSLLMDALRKAEETKRLSGENTDSEAAQKGLAELTLEPIASATSATSATISPPHSPLPLLAQHLDSVNADLAAASIATPSNKRPPASSVHDSSASGQEEKERNAARNVFAAKQSQQARSLRWLIIGLAGIAILGIGGYFWWQLQSVTQGSIARAVPQNPPAPATLLAQTTSPAPATLPPEPEPAHDTDLLRLSSATETQPKPEKAHRAAAPQLPSENSIRLSSSQPKTDPTLERAYEALQADQLADARRDYEQVLRNDARNVDALLGLATIAARQGQSGNAADLYLRALEADPKDANALAGLINLRGQGDLGLSESRLKTLLASQPDSAVLNFALGNLHARQNRWNDAQHAYFRAYTADPGNADTLYNLAVSLDHLRQNRLAAQYYQGALNAAGTRNTAFDKNQVKSRLFDLQP